MHVEKDKLVNSSNDIFGWFVPDEDRNGKK